MPSSGTKYEQIRVKDIGFSLAQARCWPLLSTQTSDYESRTVVDYGQRSATAAPVPRTDKAHGSGRTGTTGLTAHHWKIGPAGSCRGASRSSRRYP